MAMYVLIASLLIAFSSAVTAQESLTLDDFLGFPQRNFIVGTTVAGKDRVAWPERQRGVLNLWAADESDGWQPRRLTNFSEDLALSDFPFLKFTPDGSHLLFVSQPQADTNALHLNTPLVPQTFMVSFAGGKVVKLSDQSAVALTPNGESFLYITSDVRRGFGTSLWQQKLDPRAVPQHMFTVKQGTFSDFTWNAEGKILAFTSDRGDHGFVGLFAQGTPAIKWVSASVDSDHRPAWSPDGKHLAWIRAMMPAGNTGYSPFDGNMGNRGPNFAVLVAEIILSDRGNIKVANEREVFRDETFGMLTFGDGMKPLIWLDNRTLLFGSEALSRWAHTVKLDVFMVGAQPQELRSGECEDTDWLLGVDGWVYLASNCQQLDAMGIERVDPVSRKVEVVVSAKGFTVAGVADGAHNAFVTLANHFAYLQSSYNQPYAVHVKRWGTSEVKVVTQDVDWKGRQSFERPRAITFSSLDGRFELHGQLFLPASSSQNNSGKGAPGVVYTHGGSERQAFPAFHFSPVYANHFAINQWLRHQGFAVLSVNYRSGTGYSHDFRVCDGCMAFGAAEYLDIKGAAHELQKTDGVDKDHIGIWGLSYGGLNALQACARDSGLFKSCVAIAGMFNWISSSRYFTDTGLKVIDMDIQPSFPVGFRSLAVGPEPAWADLDWLAKVRRRQALAFESSPAGHVANWTSPTLLIHGDADEEVDFQETVGCVRKFRTLGRKNIEVKVFPDEDHGSDAAYKHVLQSTEATALFLRRHLVGLLDSEAISV